MYVDSLLSFFFSIREIYYLFVPNWIFSVSYLVSLHGSSLCTICICIFCECLWYNFVIFSCRSYISIGKGVPTTEASDGIVLYRASIVQGLDTNKFRKASKWIPNCFLGIPFLVKQYYLNPGTVTGYSYIVLFVLCLQWHCILRVDHVVQDRSTAPVLLLQLLSMAKIWLRFHKFSLPPKLNTFIIIWPFPQLHVITGLEGDIENFSGFCSP